MVTKWLEQEIKEIMRDQLKLLAKVSKNITNEPNVLAEVTAAMNETAKILLE